MKDIAGESQENGPKSKSALLIYCTRAEADQIRRAAKRERRTISGFVINAVMSRFVIESRLEKLRKDTPKS